MKTKLQIAIEYATQKHKGQKRKGKNIDYIVHPLQVVNILSQNGADEETMIVGVLHDVVEDTNTSLEEIEQCFGESIRKLVAFESEDKSKSYRERKKEHMDNLSQSPYKAKLVNCADKLSNITDIIEDYNKQGENLWGVFNGSKDDIKWYYGLAIDALVELEGIKMYAELKEKYQILKNLWQKKTFVFKCLFFFD